MENIWKKEYKGDIFHILHNWLIDRQEETKVHFAGACLSLQKETRHRGKIAEISPKTVKAKIVCPGLIE